MPAPLTRTTFETSRALEFFSERELIMQMGFERRAWPIALLKELLDNALDACESAGMAPEIAVCADGPTLTVEDNGPGLPIDTLERSLDYTIRVSDKTHYVSPSRGQLGNALKCVWAAPYVLQPSRPARVEVTTQGTRYQLDVRLDPLAQVPQLTLTAYPAAMIKSGTAITMHWPVEPSSLWTSWGLTFYHPCALLQGYALFNPHAHLTYQGEATHDWPASALTWTPAHEFGHIIGLRDRYSESIMSQLRGTFGGTRNTTAHPGYTTNLMAVNGGVLESRNVADLASENAPSPYWINNDDAVRDWVNAHSTIEIGMLSTANKLKVLDTLMGGWISDDDVAAMGRICGSVTKTTEAKAIQNGVDLRKFSSIGQRTKMRVFFSQMPGGWIGV